MLVCRPIILGLEENETIANVLRPRLVQKKADKMSNSVDQLSLGCYGLHFPFIMYSETYFIILLHSFLIMVIFILKPVPAEISVLISEMRKLHHTRKTLGTLLGFVFFS